MATAKILDSSFIAKELAISNADGNSALR